jgi:methionyl-tRNA formyltransferase
MSNRKEEVSRTNGLSMGPLRLYLFCDMVHGYGEPFLQVALDRARRRKLLLILVVSELVRESSRTRSIRLRLRGTIKSLLMGWRYGVRVHAVADVNSAGFLMHVEPGAVGVAVGFNQIFSAAAIERFRSLVNIHASVLPRYRGPAPSDWCLARGESWSGFTLHRIDREVDRGEILFQMAVATEGAKSPRDLDIRIARAAVPTFLRWLDHLSGIGSWQVESVDADQIYRSPLEYARHPIAKS